ncbi:DUF4160 domain-containing protein [Thauera linaloolentis]|uniref:Core-binding (CB) domain-containing protein n=1 Tax=Thauera linaloolentis (strain DSM 12138 / JCM 21573 / CCUG 41526 / CIP 105981 / IAM 15112 / NBRC 102519 / 47Lol) TaxID=1123367 RepID=N6YWB6_THAL4|nr:DUF4160 domain-containing protein [Thauera linaloolentis]ENO86393.1 hypothetical protein C666_13255 [Thauera linaloolentis 47Lol = DSM 12138]MCM8564206.1 DUF4160 domain-containing protein [Thauera linaloolentis]
MKSTDTRQHLVIKKRPAALASAVDGKPDAYASLFELWKRSSVGRRAATMVQYRRVLDAFAAFNGRMPIGEIRRKDLLAFRDHLLDSDQSPVTVNHKIGIIKTLFRTAVDYELMASNPAVEVRVLETQQRKARVAFTVEELNSLFRAEIHAEGKRPRGGGREAAFWLPLLALLTGARVEELAQLLVGDVRHAEGLGHYLCISDDAEHAQLKNGASRRRIPVHAILLDCGFLDYVAGRKGAGLLFPDLRPNSRGKLGGYFSTFFSGYLRRKVGIGDRRKVFHSFRHTFKDTCRAVGIEEEVHDALTGHAAPRASRRYGNEQYPLEPLFEAIARFEIAGLDIAHLYTRAPVRPRYGAAFRPISAYYGIVIAFAMPRPGQGTTPFVLAMWQGLEAGFDIESNQIIFGELPRNKQMLVNAWIEIHREELIANWHVGRLSGEYFRLDPLR